MEGIRQGYGIAEKHARYDALSEVKKQTLAKLKERLGEAFTPTTEKLAKAVVEDLKYEHMRAAHREWRAHRRPRPRRGAHHHLRGGHSPAHARQRPLHPR